MSLFIDKISDTDLLELANNYAKLVKNINVEKFCTLAKQAEKYYNNSKYERNELRFLQSLEERWYESLKKNKPDYSIYDEKYYVADLWACWKIYSRKYLKTICKSNSLGAKSILADLDNISICVDLGCGLSYSTATLKELFPSAQVYGTNLKSSPQFLFNRQLGQKYKFSIIENVHKINKNIDLIFASEYFEHFQNPIEHLDIILSKNPKYLIIANAFGSKSIGHFDIYYHGNKKIENKKMGRYFNDYLRFKGFILQKTKCWNNRPAYWKFNDNTKIGLF